MNQTTMPMKPQPPEGAADLEAVLRQAKQGDRSSLPALKRALDAHPEIWKEYGDLARHAEEALKRLIAGPNLLLGASLGRQLERLRQQLLADGDSPLERLLVERIVLCWLQAHHADAGFGQAQSMAPGQLTQVEKRQTGTQNRLLKAVQALATLRKLSRPALSPVELASRTVPETACNAKTRRKPNVRLAEGFSLTS